MKLPELQQRLKAGELESFYIFTGEEIAVMDIYIDIIAKIKKVTPARANEVKDITSKITNKGIMNQSGIYIISNDKEFMKDSTIWDRYKNGTIQGDNIIILIYNELDKRTKFYKHFKNTLTEFEKLSTPVLASYVTRDVGLVEQNATKLVTKCQNNYNQILLEADKIRNLAHANKITNNEAFIIAIEQDLIYTPEDEIVFQFVDSVCSRQVRTAFRLSSTLSKQGDNVLGPITLLYNNFRSMLLVQSAGNTSNLSNRTGLSGWEIMKAKEKGTNYTVGELVRIIRVIRESEKGIKTGILESKIALDYILTGIM